jgi:hypothetical protein
MATGSWRTPNEFLSLPRDRTAVSSIGVAAAAVEAAAEWRHQAIAGKLIAAEHTQTSPMKTNARAVDMRPGYAMGSVMAQ